MALLSESIWKEYRAKILQFVRSRVGDSSIAEDITQDVFVRMFQKIGSLKSEDKLQAWQYQIARNAIIDYYRSKKPLVGLPELPQPEEDAGTKAQKELSECLLPMIKKLPARYQEPIIQYEMDGKTHKDISLSLGISISGSKSRVQRGRAKLKEMFLDCCQFEFDHRGQVTDYQPRQKSCKDCN
ncbi:MAG: RNA polymerase sigma factor SigZ [Spirochaetes bacterium RIFOXYC1_FULL_54_7]|nr:MAG: RNA polymerase sigma factor SigZ [Spirochaetes bacterium RIFOXYC1_FULL_54_7]